MAVIVLQNESILLCLKNYNKNIKVTILLLTKC
jgi:hypothetical protein